MAGHELGQEEGPRSGRGYALFPNQTEGIRESRELTNQPTNENESDGES